MYLRVEERKTLFDFIRLGSLGFTEGLVHFYEYKQSNFVENYEFEHFIVDVKAENC